jgi:hypothetical protein
VAAACIVARGRLAAGKAGNADVVEAHLATNAAEAVRARVTGFAAAEVTDGNGAAAESRILGEIAFDAARRALALLADVALGTAVAVEAGAPQLAATRVVLRRLAAALLLKLGGSTFGKALDATTLMAELKLGAAATALARPVRLSAAFPGRVIVVTAAEVRVVGRVSFLEAQHARLGFLVTHTGPAAATSGARTLELTAADVILGCSAAARIALECVLAFRIADAVVVMDHTSRAFFRGRTMLRRLVPFAFRGFRHGASRYRPPLRHGKEDREADEQRCCWRCGPQAEPTLLLAAAA